MNADGSGKRNLTRNPAQDGIPSSPDGRKIAFVSNRDGRLEAHVMNADGSGQRSLTQGT
jgi:TolB protein